MSLERFLTAQASPESGFATALAELQAGRKTSHWIWYLLPQLEKLGRSSTAKFYGLKGGAEAADYLRNPTLRGNLVALIEVIAAQLARGIRLPELMGGATDSMKLVSCATLFERIATVLNQTEPSRDLAALARHCTAVLGFAEREGSSRCQVTLSELNSAAAP
ncbi:MAG TPA: DUF1810 family protein [Opitutaceae bacterium]|nr:DUF1810 family protein [Opitutaceae bacterium]